MPTKNNKNNDNSIISEYLNYHETYSKKYGSDRTLVLMQVGSFYEAYATNTRGPKLSEIAKMLTIVCTRRDKSIMEISEKNPYMMGFNMVSSQKFITLLINNGYTLIMVDQVTYSPVTRKVTNVYSPGTYIENISTQESNYSVCIYFEEELQKNSGNFLLCSGMSGVDLSTGKCLIHEAISNNSDRQIALDETIRFISSLNPSEIIIYYEQKKNGSPIEKILEYLELGERRYVVKNTIDKKFSKITYQNEFLGNIYKETGMLTPIEFLDLDRIDYARLSFILLLEFAHEHNVNIINDICKPEDYMDNNYMSLANNAIYQLNIIASDAYNENRNSKFKCLFDVVNNTSTAMGNRYLHDRLVAPLIDHEALELIYENISEIFDQNFINKLENNLKGISDIERYDRKMMLAVLQPYEFNLLFESCNDVIGLYDLLIEHKKLQNIILDEDTINKTKDFVNQAKKTFCLDKMKTFSIHNINETFFQTGIHKDLDKLKHETQMGFSFMNELCELLCEYIDDNNKNSNNNSNKITVKKSNDNYYLSLTKARANKLLENLSAVDILTLGTVKINVENLIFNTNGKSDVKITIKGMSDNADDLSENEEMIAKLTKKYYLESLKDFYKNYHTIFRSIIRFISYVDFVKSNAKTAILYNYKRPVIKYQASSGYIECRQMRHPIIERLIDHEYVPHNVSIGQELKGMLIYGPNGVGKSSIMKATGLNLIMAQAGMYVPCQEFVFSPYNALFTRITGMDNIFKGLSSFAVEMIELKSIIKRANANTLVIGDEICRGTEHISGNAIVAATIINLSELQTSFMFATHLHEIVTIPRIINLKNVKAFHISVDYDAITDSLVYSRNLREGSGEPVYGITFARYIINDNKFIELAVEIKNELLNKYNEMISGKTSRYNSNLFVYQCQLCGKTDETYHVSPLETHHINFQKDCENGFAINKPHIKKNSKANLIVLCNECHDKIHHDNLDIEGYVMTSKGKSVIVKDKNNKKILVNRKNKLIDN